MMRPSSRSSGAAVRAPRRQPSVLEVGTAALLLAVSLLGLMGTHGAVASHEQRALDAAERCINRHMRR